MKPQNYLFPMKHCTDTRDSITGAGCSKAG